MVRCGEKGVSYQEGRLARGNATHERKKCVERTCEGVIVLTKSDEGREFACDRLIILYELPVTSGWLRQ